MSVSEGGVPSIYTPLPVRYAACMPCVFYSVLQCFYREGDGMQAGVTLTEQSALQLLQSCGHDHTSVRGGVFTVIYSVFRHSNPGSPCTKCTGLARFSSVQLSLARFSSVAPSTTYE